MENGFGVFRINGKPQMHISPYDTGSYNTAGASWKSNMTPSARAQIADQSASDESSCMAHTRMPTDLAERMPTSRSSNTVQSVGSIPSLDAASRYTSGSVLADIARIVDTDHLVEIIENADMPHSRLSQHRWQ